MPPSTWLFMLLLPSLHGQPLETTTTTANRPPHPPFHISQLEYTMDRIVAACICITFMIGAAILLSRWMIDCCTASKEADDDDEKRMGGSNPEHSPPSMFCMNWEDDESIDEPMKNACPSPNEDEKKMNDTESINIAMFAITSRYFCTKFADVNNSNP